MHIAIINSRSIDNLLNRIGGRVYESKMDGSIINHSYAHHGASAALAYETLQPGSNGQEVLDARMRLYELGYFKKQPTQTEYTENMKKYVQQFEKDYGLTIRVLTDS